MAASPATKKESVQPESHFRPHQAARHVLSRVPTALLSDTVGQTRTEVLKGARHWDSLSYIYVLDAKGRLKGVASLRELLQTNQRKTMGVFKKKRLAVVYPHSLLRIAAARALKHNIKAVPVVDKGGRFMGMIGSDDILQTLEEEHVRDLLSAAGLPSQTTFTDVFASKLSQLIAWRTPWLVVGLVGGMFATTIVNVFSGQLEEILALAFFIPVMVYMGAAVGIQAQMLFVRGISYQQIRIKRYIAREFITDTTIGVIVAALLSAFAYVLTKDTLLAAIISVSVFSIISTAGLVAISTSLLLIKLGRDPAVAGGPFTTIIQDLLSLTIYFLVATAFLL